MGRYGLGKRNVFFFIIQIFVFFDKVIKYRVNIEQLEVINQERKFMFMVIDVLYLVNYIIFFLYIYFNNYRNFIYQQGFVFNFIFIFNVQIFGLICGN